MKSFFKKFFLVFFIIFIFSTFFLFTYIISFAQTIPLIQNKVVYQLPYPGILPDHPLYFIKAIRDHLIAFLNRDPIKKSEYYLLLSDKRVAMSLELTQKGKYQLAITTFSKGEKYFLKILPLIKLAKKQGNSPPAEFLEKLKTANQKHTELIDELISQSPKNLIFQITTLYQINQEIKKQLDQL